VIRYCLLEQRCAGNIAEYICVEGDPEFAALLRQNTQQFHKVRILQSLLAREERQIPSACKLHLGTASAIGDTFIEARSLDALSSNLLRELIFLRLTWTVMMAKCYKGQSIF